MTQPILYKPGDVCIGKNFMYPPDLRFNGVECTILQHLRHEQLQITYPWQRLEIWYKVEWANGETKWNAVSQDFLRLKRPPEDISSWGELEKITGPLFTKIT